MSRRSDERRHDRTEHPPWGCCPCALAKSIRAAAIAEHLAAVTQGAEVRR